MTPLTSGLVRGPGTTLKFGSNQILGFLPHQGRIWKPLQLRQVCPQKHFVTQPKCPQRGPYGLQHLEASVRSFLTILCLHSGEEGESGHGGQLGDSGGDG